MDGDHGEPGHECDVVYLDKGAAKATATATTPPTPTSAARAPPPPNWEPDGRTKDEEYTGRVE